MPGKHANPLLGWHPPAELGEWARAEAKRRDADLSVILTAALRMLAEAASLPCLACDVPPGAEHKQRCIIAGLVPEAIWTPPETLARLLDLQYMRGLEDAQ